MIENYIDGVLRQKWDSTTRTYHEYDGTGVETFSRPFTAEENAFADAQAQVQTERTNKAGLESKLASSMDTIVTQLGETTDAAGYTTVRAMQNLLAGKANTDPLTVRDGKNILGWVEKAYVNLLRIDRRLLEQYAQQGE